MAKNIWIGTDTAGDWDVAANWSLAAVPGAGDDVYLEHSTQSVTTGFNPATPATYASLNIAQSYTGQIGDSTNYLQVESSIVRIGYNDGPGSPQGSTLIKLDLGTVTTAITVEDTKASSDSRPTVRLKAVHASSTLTVRRGSVGVAFDTGEASTLASIGTTYVINRATDAKVYIGAGVTCPLINQDGGEITDASDIATTTITVDAGTLKTVGSGAITTINHRGGTGTYNGTGTITTLTISGGFADFTKSLAARTVTNLTIDAGGRLAYDTTILTLTNGVVSTKPVTLSAI